MTAQAGGLSKHGATVRAVAWVGLPVLLLLFLAIGSTTAPPVVAVLLERSAYALPVSLIVVFASRAALRSRTLERRFWLLVAVSNSALLICEILLAYWLLFIDPLGPPRVAAPFQILHLVAAMCFVGVLASMSRLSLATRPARIRYAMDMGVVALVLYALFLALYAKPVMVPGGAPVGDVLVGAGYPVASVLLVVGAVINVAGLKIDSWRPWEKLVVAALSVYICGVALWPMWYAGAAAASQNQERGILDLVQLSGHYVLMMATVYRLTDSTQWAVRSLPPLAAGKHRWLSAAVPVVALCAVTVVGAAAWSEGWSVEWLVPYAVIAGVITALTVGRSALVSLEHGSLFHAAVSDPLTAVYNHRFFHERLADEIDVAGRLGEPLAVIVLDIDDFGDHNLTSGHREGDKLLRDLAGRLVGITGLRDVVARIGGDEFGIILPSTTLFGAAATAQRIVDRIAIEGGEHPGALTLSAGVAAFPEHATHADDLFRLADCAVLAAKGRGKNRMVIFEPESVSVLSPVDRVRELERQLRVSSVRALAAAVDARDPDTRNHSQHVSDLAHDLALAAGLSPAHAQTVATAALLHDVGKIGIPDAILLKQGPLTDRERETVQQHSILGQRVLAATELQEMLPWVRSHHERWDGSGYPDGLVGAQIPLEARLLAICDSFDAMTSNRPYRSALSKSAAIQEIDHGVGSQFDPDLAETFIRMVSRRTPSPTL